MISIVILSAAYMSYLHFPQKFDMNECFIENKTSEIYQVKSKSKRDIGFKDNWIFAPMKLEAELIKSNPNTLRKMGDRRTFFPAKDDLSSSGCL
jgi:hypothetical protein